MYSVKSSICPRLGLEAGSSVPTALCSFLDSCRIFVRMFLIFLSRSSQFEAYGSCGFLATEIDTKEANYRKETPSKRGQNENKTTHVRMKRQLPRQNRHVLIGHDLRFSLANQMSQLLFGLYSHLIGVVIQRLDYNRSEIKLALETIKKKSRNSETPQNVLLTLMVLML